MTSATQPATADSVKRAAKPKQSDRITLAQGAKIAGVFPSNFAKMMERHGYAKGPDGKWSHDEAVLASIAGKELNKNQVEDKILAGPGGMTLSQARLHMQLQKLQVEIEMLKMERDERRKTLVSAEDAANSVIRWGGEMASQIRIWRESESAKHPAFANEIGRMSETLMGMIRDGVEFA